MIHYRLVKKFHKSSETPNPALPPLGEGLGKGVSK
jgi:hypothetical protein